MPVRKAGSFYASDIPDLKGYVIIVTGGNSGIGFETTLQLALHGARVYIAARSPDRVHKAIDDMKASHKQLLDLQPLKMDLQDLQSVKDAADSFMAKESRLDILINNAGLMAAPYKLTPDGFETQWQTNHLAPFYLTQLLLPLLTSTAQSTPSKTRVRIVNVSSVAALTGGMAPKTLNTTAPNLENVTGTLAAWKRYAHSKLGSILHARALHDRFRHLGITAYSLHPGIIKTNLQAADPTLFGTFIRAAVGWGIFPGTISIPDGARTTLFCAVDERAVEGSGGYFVPFGKMDGKGTGKWCEDKEVVERLWVESERMIRKAGF